MTDDYAIVVMTSDKYLPATRTFAYLFNRYWSADQHVIVSGFSEPNFRLPTNFSFISLGRQEDFPWKRWSDALYITLERVGTPFIILLLEDYWFTRRVNIDAVNLLWHYMQTHPQVIKGDLSTDRLYSMSVDLTYDTYEYLDIIKSFHASPYHFSLYPGLWNVENLRRVMIPNESPHDMEIDGTSRLSVIDELEVVGTRQNPMSITLGLRNNDPHTVITSGLKAEDREYLERHGFFTYWNGGVQ